MRGLREDEGVNIASENQMAIQRQTLQALIDCFCDYNPAYNIAHIVLDDRNLSNEYIENALKRIPITRSEFKVDHGATDNDIDQVAAFLLFLLSVPEGFRDYDNE